MNTKNRFDIQKKRLERLTKQYNSLKKDLREKELELQNNVNKENQLDTLLFDLEALKDEWTDLIYDLKKKRTEYEILIAQLKILTKENRLS